MKLSYKLVYASSVCFGKELHPFGEFLVNDATIDLCEAAKSIDHLGDSVAQDIAFTETADRLTGFHEMRVGEYYRIEMREENARDTLPCRFFLHLLARCLDQDIIPYFRTPG